MTKTIYYKYLGTNGTICSPVHLEDTYYIRMLMLLPDEGMELTNDGIHRYGSKLVPEEEAENWFEVPILEDKAN